MVRLAAHWPEIPSPRTFVEWPACLSRAKCIPGRPVPIEVLVAEMFTIQRFQDIHVTPALNVLAKRKDGLGEGS